MKRGFILGIFLVLGIFITTFILAIIANAPAGLTISRNTSTLYDEGNFSVNWTHDTSTGDGVKNYTIFIYANGVLYNKTAKNDSNLGFTFNNYTEANYTFFIEAFNATPVNYTAGGGTINATSNISMYVDRTAPLINLTTYTNGTFKNITSTLTLNISLTDALSGFTGSACFININGTNQTVFASDGWCNTTNGNLTGLSDGNNTINVYANDTVGNLQLNNSFVVWVDSTAPSATASCTPASVHTGDTITCTCSGSDSGVGVASRTASSTPSTTNTGTFTYGCAVIDNAGNSASSSASYTIEQSSSGSSGSGGSSTSVGGATYVISESDFNRGYSRNMAIKDKLKFNVSNASHLFELTNLTTTSVVIKITSDPQITTLSVGDLRKFEVTGDGYYDISVLLNKISSVGGSANRANITLTSIHEVITNQTAQEQQNLEETAKEKTSAGTNNSSNNIGNDEKSSSGSGGTFWIVLIVVVVIAGIIGFILYKMKK
jgi:hypothetical protein